MCHWMGFNSLDWINHNAVAFSIELLERGHTCTFLDFWGTKILEVGIQNDLVKQ